MIEATNAAPASPAYGILIKDRDHNKNDFLDTFRYLLDAEFPDIVKRWKKYQQ